MAIQTHTKYLLAVLWILAIFAFLKNVIFGFLLLGIFLTILAFAIKTIRKTLGLLLAILGGVASFSGIGVIIGVPMIIIGGLLIFS